MAVALVGLVVVVTMIVVPGHSTDGPSRGHARDILDERYAAGELSTEEYHERRGSLGEPDDSGRGSPPQRLALIIGIASLVVLVLVISLAMGVGNWSMPMFGHMGWGSNEATGGSATTLPDGETIVVEAGDLWFRPTELDVRVGEPVNLSLQNTGRIFHDLNIAELELDLNAQPGDTASGGLVIDSPGTYHYRCTVPGHAEAGMRGTITATR